MIYIYIIMGAIFVLWLFFSILFEQFIGVRVWIRDARLVINSKSKFQDYADAPNDHLYLIARDACSKQGLTVWGGLGRVEIDIDDPRLSYDSIGVIEVAGRLFVGENSTLVTKHSISVAATMNYQSEGDIIVGCFLFINGAFHTRGSIHGHNLICLGNLGLMGDLILSGSVICYGTISCNGQVKVQGEIEAFSLECSNIDDPELEKHMSSNVKSGNARMQSSHN
jgi:hypothetical protein